MLHCKEYNIDTKHIFWLYGISSGLQFKILWVCLAKFWWPTDPLIWFIHSSMVDLRHAYSKNAVNLNVATAHNNFIIFGSSSICLNH